jgi:predicted TIM-barrel fold metal-dependent hydrolase
MVAKIDVHQHVIPPMWVEGLQRVGSRHRAPAWSPESAINWMDAHGIATGMLSLTAPGFTGWPDSELGSAARQVNDYTAGLVAKWPNRFGNFAILPLPDLDASLNEASYAFDTLNADGVVVFSNYGDRYLGDPFFEPLWAELDRRAAIVFVHPTRLTQPELKGIPAPFVDFPFGTTRSALQMVTNGVLDRYQKMRVILSHGGGFLPYAAYRFSTFAASGPPGSEKSPTFEEDTAAALAKFRRFYVDTALASSPTSLPSLKAFMDPSHLLFGSDYAYGPGGVTEAFTSMLDESPLFTPAEHAAIDYGNAKLLFTHRQG